MLSNRHLTGDELPATCCRSTTWRNWDVDINGLLGGPQGVPCGLAQCVVVGGGYIGLETTAGMVMNGLKVTLSLLQLPVPELELCGRRAKAVDSLGCSYTGTYLLCALPVLQVLPIIFKLANQRTAGGVRQVNS